jgi:hypothetical protein
MVGIWNVGWLCRRGAWVHGWALKSVGRGIRFARLKLWAAVEKRCWANCWLLGK